MSTRKIVPALLVSAALLALGGTAMAQSPAPDQGGNAGVSQPGQRPGMHRMMRRGRKGERHPEMRRAMQALENAARALEHAEHDFHGHRAAALELVRKAQAEIKAGIESDKE